MKKVLALVLALMMAVSLMVTANAAVVVEDADEIDPKYQEAVDVLAQLGIIEGTKVEDKSEADGADKHITFEPGLTFDRASFAKILFILYTGANPTDEQYAKYENYDYFDDLDAAPYNDTWALVSINYLKERGIMIGTADRIFEPAKAITGFEVVRGLLQAIGRGKLGEFDGPWDASVVEVAREGAKRHITTGLGLTLSKELKREEVAGLVFNTLTNEEAYQVTYTEGTGYYVEEGIGYNQKTMTLGEVNWELHRYGIDSGKTYSSDKKIKVENDPFGRPTNPKWVALVKGEPVQIGKVEPIVDYYRNAVTRDELTSDFYYNFAFKDLWANTEYYVDGKKLDADADENPWQYAYDKNGKRLDDGNDTIGGVGVTVEAYMMADERVAIDDDLVELYRSGDTSLSKDPDANPWPKMRVVIVHHYAAEITKEMYLEGDNFSATADKGYETPDRLELPYDHFIGWNDDPGTPAHSVAEYERKTVIFPFADDKYDVNDAIFFSVAYSSKDGKHTVYEDFNLSDIEGCKVSAPIAYVAPDKAYIRLTDKDQPAHYITYFMQHTTTPEYGVANVAVSTTEKTVYFDPYTKDLVALMVGEKKPTTDPHNTNTYYYIEDIRTQVTTTRSINGDPVYKLTLLATAVNVKTGEKKTDLVIDWTPAKGDNEDGTVKEGQNFRVVMVGDRKVDFEVDTDGMILPTSVAASVRTSADGNHAYVVSGDTYVIKNKVTIYLDGKPNESVDAQPMVLTKDGKEPIRDDNGDLIYFIVNGKKTYVLDTINPYEDHGTTGIAKTMAADPITADEVDEFNTDVSYDAYSTSALLIDAAEEYDVEGINDKTDLSVYTIANNAWKPIKSTTPPADEPKEDTTEVEIPELVHQFVKYGDTVTYLLGKDDLAFDEDASETFVVTSGILRKNETSSQIEILVNGETEPQTYKVTGNTLVYSFKGVKTYDEDDDTLFVGYEDVTNTRGVYRYYEYEKFGTEDEEAYVLAVLVNVGTKDNPVYRVDYISVISEDADVKYDTEGNYYGIYCGYDELGYELLLYFVDPATNKMTGAVLADYNAALIDTLNTSVGSVMNYKLTDGKVTYVKILTDRETVIEANANYILTDKSPYNLYNATYYYISAGYIANVDSSYVKADKQVCVYRFYDSTNKVVRTVVVTFSEGFLESLDNGKPFYGHIDAAWEGRN